MRNRTFLLQVFILGITFWHTHCAFAIVPDLRPLPAFSGKEIAVIVNDNDPVSVRIGKYYQEKRQIPVDQVIHIKFKTGRQTMPADEFNTLKQYVDQNTPAEVQAFVLTWLEPYRVDCMSITTAFALGFDQAFCASGCEQTQANPYYGSHSSKPFNDFKIRPTMVLAGHNFEAVKQLINRGGRSDYSRPQGTAYLLKTSDNARSSRALFFPAIAAQYQGIWPVRFLETDVLRDKHDVMFYFTGLVKVPEINSNTFLPGAIADHLTSTGGMLTDSKQMSILEWLTAGATGSYGTVVEPCNFPAKFPNPDIVLHYYLRGNSLIEAYWKSVAQPGQGIFIGDPLAKPFAHHELNE